MGDVTLVSEDIAKLGDSLLTPFDSDCLKGASYDIRIGSLVFIAYPEEEGGVRAIDLLAVEGKNVVTIQPGQACVVRSLEKIQMPLDMKGHLALRTYWATQLLSYSGGPIDPGYKGFLFFPVTNISDSPISLRYGKPIVTAEFIRMARPALRPYSEREIVALKNPPGIPAKKPYDPVEMTIKIEQLDKKTASYEPLIESTRRIMDSLLLAAVAGLVAGLAFFGFSQLPRGTLLPAVGAAALGVVLVAIVIRLRRRAK